MQFRFTSLAIFVLTFGLAAFAAPVPVDAPAVTVPTPLADVQTILVDLQSAKDDIISKLSVVSKATDVTAEMVAPVIKELTAAVKIADDKLAVLAPVVEKVTDDVVDLVANIVEDVVKALHDMVDEDILGNELVKGVVSELDGALKIVLVTLGHLLPALLALVAKLLFGIADLLRLVALSLTLETFGL